MTERHGHPVVLSADIRPSYRRSDRGSRGGLRSGVRAYFFGSLETKSLIVRRRNTMAPRLFSGPHAWSFARSRAGACVPARRDSEVARMVSRLCCRRTFLMPMPKHLDVAAKGDVAEPAQPTVYVHVNWASGDLIRDLGDIIRRVRAAEPTVQFIVKIPGCLDVALTVIESEIASMAEIIPAGQHTADYLANFSRCTVVLLAYEPRIYRTKRQACLWRRRALAGRLSCRATRGWHSRSSPVAASVRFSRSLRRSRS